MAAPALRGLRKDIALVLATRGDGGRTLYETGKAVGRRSGDIQRIVHGMVADGLLGSSDPTPTRGSLFFLTDEGRAALEQDLQDGLVPGLFVERQRVLRVVATDERAMQAVFAKREYSGLLAWVVETGDGEEWLLALRPEVTKRQQFSRLIGALRAAGAECNPMLCNTVMSVEEFVAIGGGFDVDEVTARHATTAA